MGEDLGYVKYHHRILNNIRAMYVDCSTRKREINKQLTELNIKLKQFMNGEKNLTYKEYIDVKSNICQLQHEEIEVDIQLAVWDEAREICLNVIYEVEE